MTKKTKSKKKYIIVLSAMGCLTLLEVVALLKGIDGTLYSIIIAAIAGLAGLTIPTPKFLEES